MNKILLQCDNLCKRYQEGNVQTDVLHNVSFSIGEGEMMAITAFWLRQKYATAPAGGSWIRRLRRCDFLRSADEQLLHRRARRPA